MDNWIWRLKHRLFLYSLAYQRINISKNCYLNIFWKIASLCLFFITDFQNHLILFDKEASHLVELSLFFIICRVLCASWYPNQCSRYLRRHQHLLIQAKRTQLRQILHALCVSQLLVFLYFPTECHHFPRINLTTHYLFIINIKSASFKLFIYF